MATRWGIVSAGLISNDFANALNTLPPKEHKIAAVAARELERAQEFAKLHNVPVAYGSYEELAADQNVDVVYIATINTEHYENTKLMLNSGKPVLLEKPFAMNLKEAKELIRLAKSKKLFIMEGMWTRFFPAYDFLRNELAAGVLGDILHAEVAFGVPMSHADRVTKKHLGGGTVLDLGVYVLSFALFVFGPKRPKEIVALGHLNDDGVDMSMSCVFTYEKGQTAVLSTNAYVRFPNDAIIVGTKGIAKIHSPFWSPSKLEILQVITEHSFPESKLPTNFGNTVGLIYEAMEVRRCLKSGVLESPIITHEETLLLAELEDTLRSKLGVHYSVD